MQLLEERVPDAGLAGGVGVRRQRERQSQDFDEKIDGVEPNVRVPRVQNPVDQRAGLAPLDHHGGFPVSTVSAGGGVCGGLGIGEKKEENLGMNAKNGEVKRAIEGESEGIQRRQHAEEGEELGRREEIRVPRGGDGHGRRKGGKEARQ